MDPLEAAFLAQADESPEDAVTLLAYADWLDESGRRREAAFLRYQHRLLTNTLDKGNHARHVRKHAKIATGLGGAWLSRVSRPPLAGTTWVGTSNSEAETIFRYLPGGILNYSSGSGTYQNGTWRQVGMQVRMETNRHYADYTGVVRGDDIRGTARNVTGHTWRWSVRRTRDPAACDPGEPDTTVYGEH